jgi:hypothetical protein
LELSSLFVRHLDEFVGNLAGTSGGPAFFLGHVYLASHDFTALSVLALDDLLGVRGAKLVLAKEPADDVDAARDP